MSSPILTAPSPAIPDVKPESTKASLLFSSPPTAGKNLTLMPNSLKKSIYVLQKPSEPEEVSVSTTSVKIVPEALIRFPIASFHTAL